MHIIFGQPSIEKQIVFAKERMLIKDRNDMLDVVEAGICKKIQNAGDGSTFPKRDKYPFPGFYFCEEMIRNNVGKRFIRRNIEGGFDKHHGRRSGFFLREGIKNFHTIVV